MAIVVTATGSPPHTRGQVFEHQAVIPVIRITPAHAGTRNSDRVRRTTDKDHPRTRGDKLGIVIAIGVAKGSPPHTRGQGRSHYHFARRDRITPAHAGTSCTQTEQISVMEDHPRTRGDKLLSRALYIAIVGSPPHTRGQERGGATNMVIIRITPAHAGTSKSADVGQYQSKDHPRTRGDKLQSKLQKTRRRGSPPHTRGQGFSLCSPWWR